MMLKLAIILGLCGLSLAANLEEVFSWKELEFTWPNQQVKDEALKSGAYIPANNLPLGVDRWRNKLFVTVPRWKSGVASSLNYVPVNANNKTAPLIPYPSWEANTLPKDGQKPADNHITSVFRVNVDACDRLWVMDTGVTDVVGEYKQISKPTLVIFDLTTDKLLRKYEFQTGDLKDDSFFANVVVDVEPGKCDEAFAYIPDLGGYGIVVYSWSANDSWRVKHNYFHFDPLNGDLTVGGVNFQWTDGVFGLALSKIQNDGFRTMYFHPLASTHEFSVSTGVLRNKTLATDASSYHLYKIVGDRGEKTQASAGYVDEKSGVLFLTQLQRDGVACWNPKKPLNENNLGLVVQDKERLVFTNDLKGDRYDNLWVLSDRMPHFLYRSLNPAEINYRIFKVNVADAIANTPCAN